MRKAAAPKTTKTFAPVIDEMRLAAPTGETATYRPATEPMSKGDGFTAEIAPQEAVGGIAAFVSFVTVAYQTFQRMKAGMEYVDGLLNGPDTPELNVINYDQLNHEILTDLESDMEELHGKVDDIAAALNSVLNQEQRELISDVRLTTFEVMTAIREDALPTQEKLGEIVEAGANLMELARENFGLIIETAPLETILGEVAPAMMSATLARIASAGHASDYGIAAQAVQDDIDTAREFLEDLFADDGPLTQRLAANEELVTKETLIISATGFGSGAYDLLVVDTYTGPSGERTHVVAGDSSWYFGEAVVDDYPAHFNRTGSINGVSVTEDGIEAVAAELQGLTIDYMADPYQNSDEQVDQVMTWMLGQEDAARAEVAIAEIDKAGGDAVEDFLDSLPSTAGRNESDAGGSGDDVINGVGGETGGAIADLLLGGGGEDVLNGWKGNDALHGQAGFDLLRGGDGADKLFGGNHNDDLFGDAGHDKLQGENGRDMLDGGAGHDVLYQGRRGDGIDANNPDEFVQNAADGGQLYGRGGNDLLVGDNGDDLMDGGVGHDTIFGFGDADEINGGGGRDVIDGGEGDDTIEGDAGDDTIEGGAGDDLIHAGSGDDLIIDGEGDDTIDGFSGVDAVVFNGAFAGSVNTGGTDTLVFGGAPHPDTDYTVTKMQNGDWRVEDLRAGGDIDIIVGGGASGQGFGVEYLVFDNDVVVALEDVAQDPGFTVTPGKAQVNPALGDMSNDLTYQDDDPGLFDTIDFGDGPMMLVYADAIG